MNTVLDEILIQSRIVAERALHCRPVKTLSLGALLLGLACTDSAPAEPIDPVAAMAIEPSEVPLLVRDTMSLVARPRSATGRLLEGRTVQWTTSDATVVTISPAGRATAIAAGAAVIAATSEGVSGFARVVVREPQPAPVDRVVVSPAFIAMEPGHTRQLTAVLRDAEGNVLNDRLLAWTSLHPMVATVSATGVVTASRAGQATIQVASEGKTFAVSVTVTALPPLVRVDVSPASGAIAIGEALQLSAVPRGPSNEPLDRPVTWRSDDQPIATVDTTGRVTGHRHGIARITASVEGIARQAEIFVYQVTQYPLERVGNGALPQTLFTTTEMASDGTVRVVRWDAHEGYFRLGYDGGYEQAIAFWIHREGSPAVQATYVYRGSWLYDFLTPGGLVFFPVGGLPSFRGRLHAGGLLELTRRVEPNTPELTFVHGAPRLTRATSLR